MKIMNKNDLSSIAEQLYCSSILEEETAKAYKSYSKRVENQLFKPMLLFIAHDSIKHAKILRSLCKCIVKSSVSKNDCPRILGKAWKEATDFAKKELRKKGKLTNEDMCSLIDEMISLENVMSEEYLAVLHLKVLQLQTEGMRVNGLDLQKILGYIVEDEARHKVLLDRIKQLAEQPNTKSIDSFNC